MTDGRARSDKSPQDAVTAYRRLATVELPVAVGRYASARYSLLQVLPRTGRRHQIRRHMKHIFHPVIGDTSHGDGRHNRLFRDRFDNRRLLLAAAGLCWRHPYTGRATAVSAPLDADFQGIVRRLGWAALFSHDGLFDAGPDDEQCYRAMAI
jgi:tRNA pseudouridine65 synthase